MSANFGEEGNNERNSAGMMEVEPDDTAHMPAPEGTGRETELGVEGMAPPGPASSKMRYGTRSRSYSTLSSCSGRSTVIQAKGRGGGEKSPIEMDSGDSEEDGARSSSREEQLLKRKLTEAVDGGEPSKTRRKRGRPQTTGLYVGRAAAIEELNRKEREAAELEMNKISRNLTPAQLFKNVDRDMEATMEELEIAPTADVANQARSCMAEVLRVAKASKNLQGGMVKTLKHAAVVAAASADVLRTRADGGSEPENDALRQIRALRVELEGVKREAQAAREEAEALRKELAEERGKGSRRRPITEDSPPVPCRGSGETHSQRERGPGRPPERKGKQSHWERDDVAGAPLWRGRAIR